MENNFECVYESIGGDCMLTYEFTKKGIVGEECKRCIEYYNNCEICSCPISYKSKNYCKNCINNKEGYHE